MTRYKSSTGKIIDSYDYNRLTSYERADYREVDDNGDFLLSTVIGMATDNSIIGGLVGGSLLGGVVGDLLNDGELF